MSHKGQREEANGAVHPLEKCGARLVTGSLGVTPARYISYGTAMTLPGLMAGRPSDASNRQQRTHISARTQTVVQTVRNLPPNVTGKQAREFKAAFRMEQKRRLRMGLPPIDRMEAT